MPVDQEELELMAHDRATAWPSWAIVGRQLIVGMVLGLAGLICLEPAYSGDLRGVIGLMVLFQSFKAFSRGLPDA